MKRFRICFQWFTPDGLPTQAWEMSIDAYNYSNAIERAKEKVLESGREVDTCLINWYEE